MACIHVQPYHAVPSSAAHAHLSPGSFDFENTSVEVADRRARRASTTSSSLLAYESWSKIHPAS